MTPRHWQKCLATDAQGRDAIDRRIDDELIDDLTVVDPYEVHAPSRRSDKALGELLGLLDSLEFGNSRKETTR